MTDIKEAWWTSPHFRPTGSQQLPKCHAIPHAQQCRGSSCCGHTFTHPFFPNTGSFSNLPFKVTSFSSGFFCSASPSPPGCSPGACSSPVSSAILGHEGLLLPRRLAGVCAVAVISSSGHCSPYLPCDPVGPQGESKEDLLCSLPDHYLSRYGPGHNIHEGLSIHQLVDSFLGPLPLFNGERSCLTLGSFSCWES